MISQCRSGFIKSLTNHPMHDLVVRLLQARRSSCCLSLSALRIKSINLQMHSTTCMCIHVYRIWGSLPRRRRFIWLVSSLRASCYRDCRGTLVLGTKTASNRWLHQDVTKFRFSHPNSCEFNEGCSYLCTTITWEAHTASIHLFQHIVQYTQHTLIIPAHQLSPNFCSMWTWPKYTVLFNLQCHAQMLDAPKITPIRSVDNNERKARVCILA